jgi:hypothetical protein
MAAELQLPQNGFSRGAHPAHRASDIDIIRIAQSNDLSDNRIGAAARCEGCADLAPP